MCSEETQDQTANALCSVVDLYTDRFGNQAVTPDIIHYIVTTMTRRYPSLSDPDSSADDPTYISEHLGNHNSLWDLHITSWVS